MPLSMPTRFAILSLLLALAQPVIASRAQAHAVIIGSTPTVDAIVAPDSEVSLHFNSRIDHQRSRLTVIGADGAIVPLAIAPDGAADMVSGKLPGLGAGQYRLRWQVLAIDGHLTRGDIRFSVKTP